MNTKLINSMLLIFRDEPQLIFAFGGKKKKFVLLFQLI